MVGFLLSVFLFHIFVVQVEAFLPQKSQYTVTTQRKELHILRNVDPRLSAALIGLSLFGNIGEAINAVVRDPQALFCSM